MLKDQRRAAPFGIGLLMAMLLSMPCQAQSDDATPDMTASVATAPAHDAKYIVDHLDVTSFPSSIGPRRQTGKVTFKDYGFNQVNYTGTANAQLADKDGDWTFNLKILDDQPDAILVCLTDQAIRGASYHTQTLLKLDYRIDGSLTASREESADPRCPDLTF